MVDVTNRDALISLLLTLPGDHVPLPGLERLDAEKKVFMLATLCADVLIDVLWTAAGKDPVKTHEGLWAIVEDMRANINKRVPGRPYRC